MYVTILTNILSKLHTLAVMNEPAYFDCNATTPMEPEVLDLVIHYMRDEFGNAGSRTHDRGTAASRAVQVARQAVADQVRADPSEVIFTSGATEANNLAILGLRRLADCNGRRHIVTTAIEHKAVLEPIEYLATQGFEVTWVAPEATGEVSAARILESVRPDTLLVSIMHANNETGVLQPLSPIAEGLKGHPAYLHTDAAQGFGKDDGELGDPRVDLISISAHKLYGPKGVGALIARRRGFARPPLEPLAFGGGQERGLRPGTAPVALIAGLGAAAAIARRDRIARRSANLAMRHEVLSALTQLDAHIIGGDAPRTMPHVVNATIPGVDSEALMLTLRPLIAMSNGSACTSHSYEPSHVLAAMGLTAEQINGAVRLSWCHRTPPVDWATAVDTVRRLRGGV